MAHICTSISCMQRSLSFISFDHLFTSFFVLKISLNIILLQILPIFGIQYFGVMLSFIDQSYCCLKYLTSIKDDGLYSAKKGRIRKDEYHPIFEAFINIFYLYLNISDLFWWLDAIFCASGPQVVTLQLQNDSLSNLAKTHNVFCFLFFWILKYCC